MPKPAPPLDTSIKFNQKKLASTAINSLKARARFENSTGYGASKADEVLAAVLANKWFEEEGLKLKISLASAARGVDGTLIGEDTIQVINVEIKSSQGKEFWFKRDFDFSSHGCIILMEIRNGTPVRLFIAIGNRAMRTLDDELQKDKMRPSFKIGDMLRLFSENRVPTLRNRREVGIRGVSSLVHKWGTNDRIGILVGNSLGEFLKA